ncbi:MAG: bifunctional alpha/beta hydrolase/OsmC family protein [Thermoanaerobaculia bacterium]
MEDATRTERVTFRGKSGAELAARLERPVAEPRAYALFAHCFTCSKDLKAAVRISRALAEHGLGVLRFDFTGLGESEGDFAGTGFESNVEDLEAAAAYLASEHAPPRLLVGHSLGGAAVLKAAGRMPDVRAVATIGAPSTTEHLRQTLLEAAPELESAERAEVHLGGRRFTVGRELLEDLMQERLLEVVRELRRPLLIFHSPVDNVVGIEHAANLYAAARHPKSFIALDGADHLLLEREADAAFVADILAAWASRYVPELAEAEKEEADEGKAGWVVARGAEAGLRVRLTAGRHRLVADEPESVGGEDAGPDPYGYLLSALGACKAMTVRLYADRKGWPLAGSRIELKHDRVHAQDCADCETKEGKVDQIEVSLSFEGKLDDAQRTRLAEIAEMCPVHRTLTGEIKIRSQLTARP